LGGEPFEGELGTLDRHPLEAGNVGEMVEGFELDLIWMTCGACLAWVWKV